MNTSLFEFFIFFILFSRSNVVVSSFNTSEARLADYCERQTFSANCTTNERNKVVVMVTAKYGRMWQSKCFGKDGSPSANCEINVLDQFDLWCSGRRSCEVRVSSIIDSIPDNQMLPCLKELRGYLEASFVCVPVISRTAQQCSGRHTLVELTQPTGYFANVVTEETGCGTFASPWIIQASPGQTIHLRLIDFAFSGHDKTFSQKNCLVYGNVREMSFSARNTICGSDQKELNVFASETNRIEMRIVMGSPGSHLNKENDFTKKYFLLKYSLHGCADIPPGNGRWVERVGPVSVIGCNGTGEKQQLTCEENTWIGQLTDCSASNWGMSPTVSMFWSVFSETQWIAIATILGIALIIGVVIFLAGIICIRRKRQSLTYGGETCSNPRCLAEYHLARCVNDPTSLSRHGSATPKSLSLDLLGGASLDGSNVENDYFRTWQLQRNAFNNMRCPSIPATSIDPHMAHSHIVPSNIAFKPLLSSHIEQEQNIGGFENFRKLNQTLPLVEHIYESPKFDRKEYDTECYGGSIAQTPLDDGSISVQIADKVEDGLPSCR